MSVDLRFALAAKAMVTVDKPTEAEACITATIRLTGLAFRPLDTGPTVVAINRLGHLVSRRSITRRVPAFTHLAQPFLCRGPATAAAASKRVQL